jgi:pimeloyl-ACP methyl ester carboxylesterase
MSLLLAAALAACTIDGVPDAKCTTVSVVESKARKIDLNVVVIPARGTASRDAIFILQGGPGQAATKLADFYAGVFDGARETHDIVLIDQRGTGKSHPLNCDMGPAFFPIDKVTACRDELSRSAKLELYTTAEAVSDLDVVRTTLGYDKLNLYGTSYGTRVAFEYARRFQQNVRSMILKGVVAPTLRYTVDPAIDTQTSLDRVIAEAAPQYPNLRKELGALEVPRDDLAFEIRGTLHSLPGVRSLPKLIHEGNADAWKKRIESHYTAMSRELSFGMFLSVVCAEDIWRVSDAEAKSLTANTLTGDSWQRSLSAACKVWPHKAPQKEVATILQSNVPALIISGAYDPVTPPRQAEAAVRGLRNSRHVIVKYGSHSFAGMSGCVDKVMSAFVLDPDPAKVDAGCVSKIAPPGFD